MTPVFNFGPLAAYTGIPRASVSATLAYLKACQRERKRGREVSYTDNPAWLVDMAINRRAYWPDDPTESRGSCMPLADGRYPKRARGNEFMRVFRLARMAGKVVVSEREAGILHKRHRGKIRTWGTEDF